MGKDTIQLQDVVSTISKEYLLEFTLEYSIPESLHPELPKGTHRGVPEGKVGVYTNALNPTRVKIGTRPRAAHEVPLLTATASRVIDMKDMAMATRSSRTPPALEKSPLDFANEDPPQIIIERGGTKDQEVAAMGPIVNKRRYKRGNDEAKANALPKVLRKDHVAFRPVQSTLGGKSLAPMGLDAGCTFFTPATQDAPTAAKSVSFQIRCLISSRKTDTEIPNGNVATTEVQGLFSAKSLKSGKSTSFPSTDGSPGGIYQPGWGVTNNCLLDTLDAFQDMVDHIVPSGYFFKLRHLPNTDFLSQYNINLAWQVAMGFQLRLRFQQEVRLPKKATTKIARRDQRIQAREEEIKKLDQEVKSLRAVEAEVHYLHNQTKNLENLLEAEFLDLQVSNNQLSQQMDARLDKLSVDFDEELYPYMLTVIAGGRWVIGQGLRLDIMKCAESPELRQAFVNVVSAGLVKGMSEGLKHGIEHVTADRDLAAIEAYDLEADSKYVKALQDLKDLKCPQWIRDFRPSSSQLKIPIYPEKKCMVVCRTHGIGSAHHARSDGIPVFVPTIAPRGLAILLVDAATQTEVADKEDEPHPRLQQSISLPPFYNLEWE
nr:hypothetical protein [Tanacetum cinerariifolium]